MYNNSIIINKIIINVQNQSVLKTDFKIDFGCCPLLLEFSIIFIYQILKYDKQNMVFS